MIRCFERFSEAAGSLDEYEMRAMRDEVYMEFITETYKKYVVPLVSTYNSRMKKNASIINVAMQLATYLEMPDAYKVNLAIRKLLAAAERD